MSLRSNERKRHAKQQQIREGHRTLNGPGVLWSIIRVYDEVLIAIAETCTDDESRALAHDARQKAAGLLAGVDEDEEMY